MTRCGQCGALSCWQVDGLVDRCAVAAALSVTACCPSRVNLTQRVAFVSAACHCFPAVAICRFSTQAASMSTSMRVCVCSTASSDQVTDRPGRVRAEAANYSGVQGCETPVHSAPVRLQPRDVEAAQSTTDEETVSAPTHTVRSCYHVRLRNEPTHKKKRLKGSSELQPTVAYA
jgi:hypothetical protein